MNSENMIYFTVVVVDLSGSDFGEQLIKGDLLYYWAFFPWCDKILVKGLPPKLP